MAKPTSSATSPAPVGAKRHRPLMISRAVQEPAPTQLLERQLPERSGVGD